MRLAQQRAGDFSAKGGRIVSLSPGVIDTPMGRQAMAPGEPAARAVATAAIKRMGRPDEIASVVEFLISDGASFVMGCDWLVHGGVRDV